MSGDSERKKALHPCALVLFILSSEFRRTELEGDASRAGSQALGGIPAAPLPASAPFLMCYFIGYFSLGGGTPSFKLPLTSGPVWGTLWEGFFPERISLQTVFPFQLGALSWGRAGSGGHTESSGQTL